MKFFKENFIPLLITMFLGLITWSMYFEQNPQSDEVRPVQIIIPSQQGTSGIKIIETVKTVPVGKIIVDEQYKNAYENAKDSIERLNLYLNAIQVKERIDTAVSNDTIEIIQWSKTRGDLLEYKVDYNIKEKIFEYKPETIIRRPKLSLHLGTEFGVPTTPTSDFTIKGTVGIGNQRGDNVLISYDSNNTIWAGYIKSFNIKK